MATELERNYQEDATRLCSALTNKQVNNKNNVTWENVTEYNLKSKSSRIFLSSEDPLKIIISLQCYKAVLVSEMM